MAINVTIGQYYPVESNIHKLDARLKVLWVALFIAMLFTGDNFIGYGLSFLYLLVIIKISKVPFGFLLRGLKSIIMLLMFTVVINIFFTRGETLIFNYKFISIYKEGVVMASKMGIRLVLLVMASSMLTLTTSPIQLTDAIEYILKPFKKIGIPAHEIAMMMTIALRFIPTLMEEMDKIMKAQMARGASFDTGGLREKARGMIPLLIPLFISAFRRADDLAIAMEARCYRGDVNRTRRHILKFKARDYKALCIMVLVYCAVVMTKYI